jgi:hypothetical protein
MSQPLPIKDLRVIGYTGHLPESMRPGYVAAVFEDKAGNIWLAPYELHENYLTDASCIDRARFDSFVAERSITPIPEPFLAEPGYVLWQEVNGSLQYHRAGVAERKLREIHVRELKRAGELLQAGSVQEALTAAGIAFAANPVAESYAMTALCHERNGEHDLARACRFLAVNSGHSAETFDALLIRYRETHIPKSRTVQTRRAMSPLFVNFLSNAA